MSDRDVDFARQEARKRKRSGQAKSYTAALLQLATENGHEDWASYSKVLAATPDRAPDFRVRLVGAGNEERTIGLSMKRVLEFHEMVDSAWMQLAAEERVHHVLECALSTRHERGDMARYVATLIASNIPSVPSEVESVDRARASQGINTDPADFTVELESRANGKKEHIDLRIADVLEFHGMAMAEWEGSGRQERESLVEEVAIWSKIGAGDTGSYFSQVVSGFDGEDEESEFPR